MRNVAFENENSLAEKFRIALVEVVEKLSFEACFSRQILFPAKETINFSRAILNELMQNVIVASGRDFASIFQFSVMGIFSALQR